MEVRGNRIWNGRSVTDAEAERILNKVIDSGINFIDTAYDYGRSEEYIGKYLSGRRSEFYLATKCGCTVVDKGDHDETPHVWTRDNLLHNIETSLKRMKTDYVDIWQLHNPSVAQVDEGGLVGVMEEVKRSGKVRHVAISSTYPDIVRFIETGVFDAFQIPYSALERRHELVISDAAKAGAGIIIRGGVARGEPGSGLGKDDTWAKWKEAKLDELCDEGETPTVFLLRYTISHPDMHTTIVGTKNPEHLREDIQAIEKGKLPDDVYEEAKRRLDAVGAVSGPTG